MKEEITIVNGRAITHRDVIHHTTTTVFSFVDRMRILFGKKVWIDSQIYTQNEEAKVVASAADVRVEKIFKKKFKGGLVRLSPNMEVQDAVQP